MRLTRNEVHKILIETAAKSPAKKRKVGAVIVSMHGDLNSMREDEYEIVASGYNYNMAGGSCEDEQGNTVETVIHAEVSCLNDFVDKFTNNAALVGRFKMFVTHQPCDGCLAALKKEHMPYEVIGDFLKFDSSKPRMSLVPPSLMLEVAKVLTYGAHKYKVNNWRKTPDIESYINALHRHLNAWQNGEDVDPESGLSHLSHAACNIAFLIELQNLPRVKE